MSSGNVELYCDLEFVVNGREDDVDQQTCCHGGNSGKWR